MATPVAWLQGPRGRGYPFSAEELEALRAQLTPAQRALAARQPALLARENLAARLQQGTELLTLDGHDLASLFTQAQSAAPVAALAAASPPRGPIIRIHVNQHVIRSNGRDGTREPVLTVKRGRDNRYAHEVQVLGPCRLVYSPDKPLPCGARVWIETRSEVLLDGRSKG